MDTMINLLNLASRLEWLLLILLTDRKAVSFKLTFPFVSFGVFTETVKLLFAFLFPLGCKICHRKQHLTISD
jgi:hypothetical protein